MDIVSALQLQIEELKVKQLETVKSLCWWKETRSCYYEIISRDNALVRVLFFKNKYSRIFPTVRY